MKIKSENIASIIIILTIVYVIGTPTGALRFAIARTGNPITAVNLKISDKPYKKKIGKNQMIYTLINPPVEKSTYSELKNWIITKYGLIYWGNFYGL
ncbi:MULTISPECIES: hypothetical protein [Clostridia]|uniref:hypothetical protein n=1 Tax=Clostridium sp. CCUG 7971 TaxID=2811414 RepID=UPI001ABA2FD9|nr:hypothetical protein [Clostridium sp. CCUG 7971]MBO3446509.1 hypothetical protein [Clostridium sp. CCUG 7971]